MTSSGDNTPVAVRTRKRGKTPKWLKRLGNQRAVQEIAAFLIACYIGLVRIFMRLSFIRPEIPEKYFREEIPFIYCFWHGRLLMMPFGWRSKMKVRVLISSHRDGVMIARAISYHGIHTIHGSSPKEGSDKKKGGAAALRAMVKAIKNGDGVAITPDGPSGPYMRASEGVVALAKLTGVPIIPVACSTTHRKILNTWDKFLWPRPFSRCVFGYGEPIIVDRNLSPEKMEEVRQLIEDRLNALTQEVDALTGYDVMSPAPLKDA